MVLRNNAQIEQIVHVNKLRIYVWYISCIMNACVQYVACRLKCVRRRQRRRRWVSVCDAVNITDPSNSYYNLINFIDNAWMRAKYTYIHPICGIALASVCTPVYYNLMIWDRARAGRICDYVYEHIPSVFIRDQEINNFISFMPLANIVW